MPFRRYAIPRSKSVPGVLEIATRVPYHLREAQLREGWVQARPPSAAAIECYQSKLHCRGHALAFVGDLPEAVIHSIRRGLYSVELVYVPPGSPSGAVIHSAPTGYYTPGYDAAVAEPPRRAVAHSAQTEFGTAELVDVPHHSLPGAGIHGDRTG